MNIHDQNNRGFLALKLNRAAGKKKETGVSIAKALGIHSTTASKILRGGHASMELYEKVANYLGVPIKPEKSILSRLGAQGDDFVGIGAASILDALGEQPEYKFEGPIENKKKLTKKDIVEQEKAWQEMQCGNNGCTPIQEIHVPAPIVQNELTKLQAWVIMALQVVVILFLIFPTK